MVLPEGSHLIQEGREWQMPSMEESTDGIQNLSSELQEDQEGQESTSVIDVSTSSKDAIEISSAELQEDQEGQESTSVIDVSTSSKDAIEISSAELLKSLEIFREDQEGQDSTADVHDLFPEILNGLSFRRPVEENMITDLHSSFKQPREAEMITKSGYSFADSSLKSLEIFQEDQEGQDSTAGIHEIYPENLNGLSFRRPVDDNMMIELHNSFKQPREAEMTNKSCYSFMDSSLKFSSLDKSTVDGTFKIKSFSEKATRWDEYFRVAIERLAKELEELSADGWEVIDEEELLHFSADEGHSKVESRTKSVYGAVKRHMSAFTEWLVDKELDKPTLNVLEDLLLSSLTGFLPGVNRALLNLVLKIFRKKLEDLDFWPKPRN